MQALKLSSNTDEKKQLKAQCSEIMNVADRIKNTTHWTPLAKPPPQSTRNERIDQWAAEVAITAEPTPALEGTVSQSSSSRHDLSSRIAPVENIHPTLGNYPTSSVSAFSRSQHVVGSDRAKRTNETSTLLIDLSDDHGSSSPENQLNALADNSNEVHSTLEVAGMVNPSLSLDTSAESPALLSSLEPRSQPVIREIETASLLPSTAPYSQIHRLAEPMSTRKRSKKEDIILLKASIVNGFKCPPWDKTPSTGEFLPQDGVELFT